MADGDWFDIPGQTGTQETQPIVAGEWFDLPTDTTKAEIERPTLEIQLDRLIKNAPDPEKVRKIAEQAMALNQAYGFSIEDSFQKADALNNSPDPEPKRFGKAIADNVRAQQL